MATNGAPLRVVVHHPGRIQPGTQQALAQERLHHRTNDPPYRPAPLEMYLTYVYCPPTQPHAYGDSLRQFWEWGRPFINLEADVAPWPGALTELWQCPRPWCALPLVVHNAVNEKNLGCVKFSREFIALYPDLWATYPRNEIFDWRSLDGWLYQRVQPARPHTHEPPALHLNPAHIQDGAEVAHAPES